MAEAHTIDGHFVFANRISHKVKIEALDKFDNEEKKISVCQRRPASKRTKGNKVQKNQEITTTIIAMERAALDRWGSGDPSGFLEISAPDVVYFDPYQGKRLDGLEALTALYESIRDQVHVDRYELLNPYVQATGDIAVLTFNYVSYNEEKASCWNCTEVYRRDGNRWQIIQTHWSYTRHPGVVNN